MANSSTAAEALFYGELSIEDAASRVRAISEALMALAGETWAAIRGSGSLGELTTAVAELSSTVRAMHLDDPRGGAQPTSTCLVAGVREGLREYRRRLAFVGANAPLDRHSRGLLSELLGFDRWFGAHLERCQECRQGVQHL